MLCYYSNEGGYDCGQRVKIIYKDVAEMTGLSEQQLIRKLENRLSRLLPRRRNYIVGIEKIT